MNYKHGLSDTRLYVIWQDMRGRCNRTDKENYKSYNGRGITVCEEWETDFVNFYTWALSNGYNDTLTIERINNDIGYNPNNCKWIPLVDQYLNRRSDIMITYNSETKNIKEWSKVLGIKYETLRRRLHSGLTMQESIDMPKGYNTEKYKLKRG